MQNALLYMNVSTVCQGTQKVSEKKTLSLFLRTQISKTQDKTGMIKICCQYDVISEMWAGFTPTALSETMCDVLEVIWSLFTLASIANTQI